MQSNVHPYSTVRIATKGGSLAQIWLAANMSNLPKISVLQTSIQESADEIAKASGCNTDATEVGEGFEHITLHTSGDLLQGIVRVYSKQAAFLLTDIKDTLMKISTIFKANQRINVTIGKGNTITSIEQLILQDSVTEREVLSVPSLDFLENDQTSHNLLDGDNSMRRRVQGAAPWDTSLEIGRGFGRDDDLDLQETSALDLDFDFEDGHAVSASKTWEEGTRQTTLDEGSTAQGHVEPVPLIADDDFPLDDPNNGQWDLGISERGEQDSHGENSSTMSVELGRRADNASMIDETEDLGIDLGIEKEPLVEEPIAEEEPAAERVNRIIRSKKNPELANVRVIELDTDTELNEPQTRQTIDNTTTIERSEDTDNSITKKRILDELRLNIGYLPSAMLAEVLSFQQSKRQKLNPPDDEPGLQEPEMDISLSLDENLISKDDINSDASDINESDHFMPIAADIGPEPTVEDFPDLPERESSQTETISSEQPQEEQLSSSGTASKTTIHMAELLRTEFRDSDEPTFDRLLSAKHSSDTSHSREDISKEEASTAFFGLLSLANEDCIDLSQQDDFGSIRITTKPDLFTKFITA